jgi:hypothetical protein
MTNKASITAAAVRISPGDKGGRFQKMTFMRLFLRRRAPLGD